MHAIVKILPVSYILKINSSKFYVAYTVAELRKLLYENNILHNTIYFYKEVIYYNYILLNLKSNFVILLLLSSIIAS